MALRSHEHMTIQQQFDRVGEVDLLEEQDPPENAEGGGLRTRNPEGARWQREFVHLSQEGSKFQKTVQMVFCGHGWEKTTKATESLPLKHHQPMSLLVFRFHLTCHDPDHRFESCRIWFRFYDDNDGKEIESTAKASPKVVAWAPFVKKEEKWNKREAQKGQKSNVGGSAGVQQVGKADINGGKEWTTNFTRDYFDRGSSVPLHNDSLGRTYGVEWYFQQNRIQNYGIEPNFQVAILLKRDVDNEGNHIPFMGTFEMRVQAGMMEDFLQGIKRFFWPHRIADEPLYFDPNRPTEANGPDSEKWKEEIDTDNLGKYATGIKLTALSEVPGLEPTKLMV
ncbi:hypothetical protein B0J14DRAFT_573342 [Halenospora varia]|nr:hypothetical protein B0J14DRAFT_573342 [Halenospora varia]